MTAPTNINQRQQRIVDLMRADPRRDLYEGAAPAGSGSGEFWVTYSAEESYEPLNWDEVRDLEARGITRELWPGCYCLIDADRTPPMRTKRRKA
jgi:hypothetical protein